MHVRPLLAFLRALLNAVFAVIIAWMVGGICFDILGVNPKSRTEDMVCTALFMSALAIIGAAVFVLSITKSRRSEGKRDYSN
jgi:hypothetical protein